MLHLKEAQCSNLTYLSPLLTGREGLAISIFAVTLQTFEILPRKKM
jgi:hypothetical protein